MSHRPVIASDEMYARVAFLVLVVFSVSVELAKLRKCISERDQNFVFTYFLPPWSLLHNYTQVSNKNKCYSNFYLKKKRNHLRTCGIFIVEDIKIRVEWISSDGKKFLKISACYFLKISNMKTNVTVTIIKLFSCILIDLIWKNNYWK